MSDLFTKKPSQIVVYSTENCPDCRRARQFFEANNIAYLRVDLEGNAAAAEFVRQVNNGYRSVPTIIFPDGTVLVEPSSEELKQRFKIP